MPYAHHHTKRHLSSRSRWGWILYPTLGVVLLVALALGYFTLTEYRPGEVEPAEIIYTQSDTHPLPDTLTVVSWNIGYAGLDAQMDFFYDGGTQVRGSEAQLHENLHAIASTLKELNADVILLQEVDRGSKRSYGVDELRYLLDTLPTYHATYAPNFRAQWVPIPLREPIGQVESGVAILTRSEPLSAERHAYPSSFPYPTSLFNLKRALLTTQLLTRAGDTLTLGNTHNTAFDTGDMRTQELTFLRSWIERTYSPRNSVVIGGDWNQLPPSYRPSPEELSNPHFTPQPIPAEALPAQGSYYFDSLTPSLRFLDLPLAANPTRTMTDFFWVSEGAAVLSIETLDLGFAHSDHHPVVLKIRL